MIDGLKTPPRRRRARWDLPMFEHRSVSLSRHAAALVACAILIGTGLALLVAGSAAINLGMIATDANGRSAAQVAMGGAIVVWLAGTLAVLMTAGFFFTVAHLLLRLIGRNFGALYPAWGLLSAILTCRLVQAANDYQSGKEMASYAALGVVAGLIYWSSAAGRRVEATKPSGEGDQLQLSLG